MGEMIIVGTDALLFAARQMKKRGEITLEQYAQMLRRNETIAPHKRVNTIVRDDVRR